MPLRIGTMPQSAGKYTVVIVNHRMWGKTMTPLLEILHSIILSEFYSELDSFSLTGL
jgi:hypothetical protein